MAVSDLLAQLSLIVIHRSLHPPVTLTQSVEADPGSSVTYTRKRRELRRITWEKVRGADITSLRARSRARHLYTQITLAELSRVLSPIF